MKQALVPVHAGVLSALGMLVAAPSREMSRTFTRLLAECDVAELEQAFAALEQKAREEMKYESAAGRLSSEYAVELRYKGQSFTLDLPWQALAGLEAAFHQRHQQRYGHALDMPVELVNIRVTVRGDAAEFKVPEATAAEHIMLQGHAGLYGIEDQVPVYQRDCLGPGQMINGPALIVEKVSTTLIARGWQCKADAWGNLLLNRPD
jgi:N-methylhydantoinase A